MQQQNKTVQWVLAAAVILIWGLVWYRYRQLNTPLNTNYAEIAYSIPELAVSSPVPDSLEIRADYPDPFLNYQRQTTAAGQQKSQVSAIRQQPRVRVASADVSVQYLGFSQDSNKRRRARLAIGGESVTLETGQRYGELEIISISVDSARVRWQGRSMVIPRQKKAQ